jgi:hypothetical protein
MTGIGTRIDVEKRGSKEKRIIRVRFPGFETASSLPGELESESDGQFSYAPQ